MNFMKVDLHTGDILLHRNGDVSLVLIELDMSVCADNKYYDLGRFKQDLSYDAYDGRELDIVAVRRPTRQSHCKFEAFEYYMGDLVYQR